MRVNLITWITIISFLGGHLSRAQEAQQARRAPEVQALGGLDALQDTAPINGLHILRTNLTLVNPNDPNQRIEEVTEVFEADSTLSPAAQRDQILDRIADMETSYRQSQADPEPQYYAWEDPNQLPKPSKWAKVRHVVSGWIGKNMNRVSASAYRVVQGAVVTYIGITLAPAMIDFWNQNWMMVSNMVSGAIFGYFGVDLENHATRNPFKRATLNFLNEWFLWRFVIFNAFFNAIFFMVPIIKEGLDVSLSKPAWDVLKYSGSAVLGMGLIQSAFAEAKKQLINEHRMDEGRLDQVQTAVAAYAAALFGLALATHKYEGLSNTIMSAAVGQGVAMQIAVHSKAVEKFKELIRLAFYVQRPKTCSQFFF